MGSRGSTSTSELSVREVVLVANTVHAMILQPVHVLVCLVTPEILAFIWFVDDDSVFGRDDTRCFLLSRITALADDLRLRYLVDGKLRPFLTSPLFGGVSVDILQRKSNGCGRE